MRPAVTPIDTLGLVSKAAVILRALGDTRRSILGTLTLFRDDVLVLESYRQGGLNMAISYADTGQPVLDVWNGTFLLHEGDHHWMAGYVEELFMTLAGG